MACDALQPNNRPQVLELPLEIRLRIYEFIFASSKVYIQVIISNAEERNLHTYGSDIGLLLTCRQIYHEARSEWYTANLWTVGFPPALAYFLRSTTPEARSRVRHLTIQIHELPDLNTKLLPGLQMLVIDFTTNLPSFMTGRWFDYDDEKIYSRFSDEAVARVHSTFKVLITDLHGESRMFQLGLIANAVDDKLYYDCRRRHELFVNLDTKLVQRRTTWPPEVDEHFLCPEYESVSVKDVSAQRSPSPSEASEAEPSPERSLRVLGPRYKFPPGREGPFGDDDKDDRGSIRESEQEDSDDYGGGDGYDDDDDDDDEEEATKRVREAARRVDWEDVKRIVEHPSEDERSVSFDESDNEDNDNGSDSGRLKSDAEWPGVQSAASEDDSEHEERVSEAGRLTPEVEHAGEDEQSASTDHVSGDEGTVQTPASRRLRAEVDCPIRHLILGSRTASPEPESEPEQEQRVSTGVSVSSPPESKLQVAAVQVAGDQHRRVEERVIYTTRWPEPVSTSTQPPNPEAMLEAAEAPECIPQQRSGRTAAVVVKGVL